MGMKKKWWGVVFFFCRGVWLSYRFSIMFIVVLRFVFNRICDSGVLFLGLLCGKKYVSSRIVVIGVISVMIF